MANPILDEDLSDVLEAVRVRVDRLHDATVLVTGCAGFLGFYFLQFLVRYAGPLRIRKVIGLDSFLLGPPQWLDQLKAEFPQVLQVHKFDIACDELNAIEGADAAHFVVHMASVASPTFYRRYPVETLDANVWGLRRLLEAYRGSPALRGLLFFSSSEIYGDPEPRFIPTDEEYRGNVATAGPRACYDEAKRFGETLCYVFANTYGMPITVVRPFNNYGPGMRIDDLRLPADFAKSVIRNEDIVILSDGSPTRTFCYVSDALGGYLLALLSGAYDYFNIGIEEPEIRVANLARIYQQAGREIHGYSGEVLFRTSPDANYLVDNPTRRCPVIDKARKKLGYRPKVRVEDGVRRYLQFLKYESAA